MTERLLQFIWQHRYFNTQELTTVSGGPVQVVSTGMLNADQGPDFKQARIRIGETLWAGDVELHVRSADFLLHQHSDDPNYQKLILHVVWEHDVAITDAQGNAIPTIQLKGRVARSLLERYEQWMQLKPSIPCSADAASVPALAWHGWKERMCIERMQQRAVTIGEMLQQTRNDWETVFWQWLCRYFGGPVNSASFEQVAASLPLTTLAKHKGQLDQIEALLFGQAGLLQQRFKEAYPLHLQQEYAFLQKKYGLKPVQKPPAFLRMRPDAFPTVRLAQLAMLIHHAVHLFSKVKEADDAAQVKELLQVTAGHYWNDHYRFEDMAEHRPKKLGAATIDRLLINAVIPVLYAYGAFHGQASYCDKAIRWMEAIKPENNHITRSFTGIGIANTTAFDSQALIQLKQQYCDAKRCLECAIGNGILKRD